MLRALAEDLVALLLPGKCPGCGRRAEPVCRECAASMRAAPPGRPIPGAAGAVSVFAYEGVARELIARVKYRNERVAVRWLAARLAERCAPVAGDLDVITWVPASAARRAARGIDHGALLARAVGAALHVAPECLLRRDDGPAQTGRPLEERRAGPALEAMSSIAGRRVLVVDDVTTTGATLSAATSVLRACGARVVFVATIARTPKPSERKRSAAYTPATQSGTISRVTRA
jgi:ComF family protein